MMKRPSNLWLPVGFVALTCSVIVMFSANFAQTGTTENTQKKPLIVTSEKVAEEKPATKNLQLADAPLYAEIPRSLTPVECGGCHPSEYKLLRQSISKHRFACTDCHEQLHAYVPTKDNYTGIMPKCSNCHELPHGETFTMCRECHQDPHTPLDIPFAGVSRNFRNKVGKDVVACEICHYEKEGLEFETYPSKHNEEEVGCIGCHEEKHGYRPTCFDCHDPHVEGQTYAECLVCHKPHSAMEILPYPEETDNKVCGSCHDEVFDNLQANVTKHTELQCATCHTVHGEIPTCQDCHDKPHGAKVLKKFTDCLDCHIDPHDLPVDIEKKVE